MSLKEDDPGRKFLEKDYLGRGIIVGYDDTQLRVIYFLMGRSESSQAKVLEHEGNSIIVKPTDLGALSKGDLDLLLYNAILYDTNNPLIVVGNGGQTESVFNALKTNGHCLIDTFMNSLRVWSFEPDEPNYTPRISGVLTGDEVLLSLIKKDKSFEGGVIRGCYQVLPGEYSTGLTTYLGDNVTPLPSYAGDPFAVELSLSSAKDLAQEVWALLNPLFRVSIASLILGLKEHTLDAHIINKKE